MTNLKISIRPRRIFKNLIIIFLTAILLAVVSGCGKTTAPTNTNEESVNQEPPVVNTDQATTTKTTCGENEQTIFLKDEEIDTSDWVTYRNEKYGYELKYPDTWKMDSLTDDFILHSKDYRNVCSVEIRPHSENPNDLDIQEWFKQHDLADWQQTICLDGIKAITSRYDDLSQYSAGSMVLIDFSYNKIIFEAKWYDGEQDNKASYQAYKEFLRILEAIRFTSK